MTNDTRTEVCECAAQTAPHPKGQTPCLYLPAEPTLTEFLLARIAEDEAWAREASRHHDEPLVEGGEHWRWVCPHDEVVAPDTDREFMECSHEHWSMSLRSVEQYPYRSIPGEGPSIHFSLDSELTPTVAGHIARHDPARVLAECEAKRRIVEWHESWPVLLQTQPKIEPVDPSDLSGVTYRMSRQIEWQTQQEYRARFGDEPPSSPILLMLAAVYADHPDYRDEWKP